MIFCSGKVYYDLRAERRARGTANLPLVRIAQIYPFAHEDFRAQIVRYKNATDWIDRCVFLLQALQPDQSLDCG